MTGLGLSVVVFVLGAGAVSVSAVVVEAFTGGGDIVLAFTEEDLLRLFTLATFTSSVTGPN